MATDPRAIQLNLSTPAIGAGLPGARHGSRNQAAAAAAGDAARRTPDDSEARRWSNAPLEAAAAAPFA
jgi:hypothetical protein